MIRNCEQAMGIVGDLEDALEDISYELARDLLLLKLPYKSMILYLSFLGLT